MKNSSDLACKLNILELDKYLLECKICKIEN